MVVLLAPAGQQLVDADGIDHGAGQDMRADLGTLFQDDDGDVLGKLLDADRGGKACGAGTDDHNVEFHRFARLKLFSTHDGYSLSSTGASPCARKVD